MHVMYLCKLVARRSAALVGACLAGLLKQIDRDGTHVRMQPTTIAVDGGLFEHYTAYRGYLRQYLDQLLGKQVSCPARADCSLSASPAVILSKSEANGLPWRINVKLHNWKGNASLSTTRPSGATSPSIWTSCWASRSAALSFLSISSSPKLGSSPGTSGQHRYRQAQMQPSQGYLREHQGHLLGKQAS